MAWPPAALPCFIFRFLYRPLPKLPQLGALECLANAARIIKLRNAIVQKAQDASGMLVVELLEVFDSAFGQFNLPSHTAS